MARVDHQLTDSLYPEPFDRAQQLATLSLHSDLLKESLEEQLDTWHEQLDYLKEQETRL